MKELTIKKPGDVITSSPVVERCLRLRLRACERKAEEVEKLIDSLLDGKVKHAKAISETITAPDGTVYFPSPHVENRFPVDLAMNVRGVCCFFQFKRSSPVLEKHVKQKEKLKEWDEIDNDSHSFKLPLYRVHFQGKKIGKSGDQKQRDKLDEMETHFALQPAAIVRYVAPTFHTLSELTHFHNSGFSSSTWRRSPVVCFRASQFDLPDKSSHWISFTGKEEFGFRYSSEPKRVEEVLPLIDVINSHAKEKNVPILKNSIQGISGDLDSFAEKVGITGNCPEELLNRSMLDVLGISIEDASAESGEQIARTKPGVVYDQESDAPDDLETILIKKIRKIMENGDFERVASRISFAKYYCRADYRCRQILGQPLMVHSLLDPGDLP